MSVYPQHRRSQKDWIRVRIRNILYFVFITIGCFSCKTTPSCGHSSSWPAILSHGSWRLKNRDAHCTHIRCEHLTELCKMLTVHWSRGVWEVLGLLKNPCWGTKYSSASTASSMSSSLIRVRNSFLSVGLGRCMRSSPWNIESGSCFPFPEARSVRTNKQNKKSYLYDKIARRISSHFCKLSY